MTDNDFQVIKPVESMQNVTGLSPAKRRQERKKQQNHQSQNEIQHERIDEQLNPEIIDDDIDLGEDDLDKHTIDFRA